MTVLRLRCCFCGKAHTILTGDMIPFFLYSIQIFLILVCLCIKPEGSVLKTEDKSGVSYQLQYRFLEIFHEYAKRLSVFLRLEGMWDGQSQLLNSQLLPIFKEQPPPILGSRYFTNFRRQSFLNQRITGINKSSFRRMSKMRHFPK